VKRREAVAALVVGTMIVLGVMVVFAIQLANNQASSKQEIQSRVHERAVLAGALIDSLFQTSARSAATLDSRIYGTRTVSNRVLDRAARNNRYLVLLSSSGAVLAHSKGFSSIARSDLPISEALKLLRAGKPWALGNVLPYPHGGVINYGLTVPTRYGPRYVLTGFGPNVLGPFLLGELREIPGVKGAHNLVLDAHGEVLASTYLARPTGYIFHTPVQLNVLHHSSGTVSGHYYDQVPLPNTSWRILLSAPTGPLFASVSGLRKWLPWLIFVGFAAFALIALLLSRRALRTSEQIAEAHASLEVAHSRLSAMNSELESTNSELAHTNAELEKRADELLRSNAELEQFASIASHDLQEPLRKVRTFTERVRETEGDDLSERGLEYLRRANASAERMQQLIEDLLRYSRVSTQGRPFAAVDLDQVAADVVEDLEEAVLRSGAVIRVGSLPTISADPMQMRQLLQNLISNGFKFRREGVTPEVDVSATSDEDWVKIVVSDNGIGFGPQYARRIFRVFERLHGRGAYPGTGIGLALCRKIAERHGGTVFAHSVVGEGSVFTVTLQTRRTEAVTGMPAAHDHDEHAQAEEPYVAV
jgi:signal transduction histidine kinase